MVILNFLKSLFGAGSDRNVVTETLGHFEINQENQAVREASFSNAALAQYATEFRPTRSWFDSLMDGLNRLPRPMFAFGVFYLFFNAMTDPTLFAVRMAGLSAVPEPMWWLLGLVITFYFGGRFQAKSQDFGRMIDSSIRRIPHIMKTVDRLESMGEDWSEATGFERAIEEDFSPIDDDFNPVLQEKLND